MTAPDPRPLDPAALARLRRLALEAADSHGTHDMRYLYWHGLTLAQRTYYTAAEPAAVLALLDALARAEAACAQQLAEVLAVENVQAERLAYVNVALAAIEVDVAALAADNRRMRQDDNAQLARAPQAIEEIRELLRNEHTAHVAECAELRHELAGVALRCDKLIDAEQTCAMHLRATLDRESNLGDALAAVERERDAARKQLGELRSSVVWALSDEQCVSEKFGVIEACPKFMEPEAWCMYCKLRAALTPPDGAA